MDKMNLLIDEEARIAQEMIAREMLPTGESWLYEKLCDQKQRPSHVSWIARTGASDYDWENLEHALLKAANDQSGGCLLITRAYSPSAKSMGTVEPIVERIERRLNASRFYCNRLSAALQKHVGHGLVCLPASKYYLGWFDERKVSVGYIGKMENLRHWVREGVIEDKVYVEPLTVVERLNELMFQNKKAAW